MSIRAVCLLSAVGTVACYLLWIIAAADDYDGGVKHLAAVAAGVLDLLCFATLVVSLGALVGRHLRGSASS